MRATHMKTMKRYNFYVYKGIYYSSKHFLKYKEISFEWISFQVVSFVGFECNTALCATCIEFTHNATSNFYLKCTLKSLNKYTTNVYDS